MTEHIAVTDPRKDAAADEPDMVGAAEMAAILKQHADARGGLIAVLEDVQARYGYLPEAALRIVAEHTGRSLADIYSVATFYSSFSLKPRGRHIVCACMGTACHVRGASRIVNSLEGRLGVGVGETTPDKEFTLETVNCLGACALGPVVVVDGRYHSKVKNTGVRQLIDDAMSGAREGGTVNDKRIFPVTVRCPRCNRSLMDDNRLLEGLPAIRLTVTAGSRHGRYWLSSLYGGANGLIEHDIPAGEVMNHLCPHCHGRLTGEDLCDLCEGPMAVMMVEGGGALKICSRAGCGGRMLDVA